MAYGHPRLISVHSNKVTQDYQKQNHTSVAERLRPSQSTFLRVGEPHEAQGPRYMRSARRGAASCSGPYTFHNLRRSIQNTNNRLHDHTGDAPRHALEEAADAALLSAPYWL